MRKIVWRSGLTKGGSANLHLTNMKFIEFHVEIFLTFPDSITELFGIYTEPISEPFTKQLKIYSIK